jgi:hypothetical protein
VHAPLASVSVTLCIKDTRLQVSHCIALIVVSVVANAAVVLDHGKCDKTSWIHQKAHHAFRFEMMLNNVGQRANGKRSQRELQNAAAVLLLKNFVLLLRLFRVQLCHGWRQDALTKDLKVAGRTVQRRKRSLLAVFVAERQAKATIGRVHLHVSKEFQLHVLLVASAPNKKVLIVRGTLFDTPHEIAHPPLDQRETTSAGCEHERKLFAKALAMEA